MSAEKFCEGQEFTAKRLYDWSSRLHRRQAREAAPIQLARVVRRVEASMVPVSRSSDPVTVEVQGARILVPAGADARTLAVILEALARRTR